MATAASALADIRTVISNAGISTPIYWHGDDAPILPDTPTAFAYLVFNNEGSRIAGFGGGARSNLYRSSAILEAFVFAPPNGADGMASVMTLAESFAAALRSYRDNTIACFGADVIPVGPGSSITPPGLQSEVNNYLCAVAEIRIQFDQIG